MNREFNELGLYIHIPFCKSKCYYCDFVSFPNMKEYEKKYIDAVCKEINNKINELKNNEIITTIYIGGGTPSYIDSELIERLLDSLRIGIQGNKSIELSDNCEITIEINPGTVDEFKMLKYKEIGINRVSIGLQSTKNYILKSIGRIHNYEQFLETYELVKKVGIDNINIDLMLALPNQTIQDLEDSISEVIKLNPTHVSVYSLIIEEDTKIEKMIDNGEFEPVSDEIERKMYWLVKNKLEEAGYNHYEISNFSKKGVESKHNMNCWLQKDYLGFGLAAHSYKDNRRFSNIEDIEVYIKNMEEDNMELNIVEHENQTQDEKMKEYMLLNLRKIDGVDISDFKNKFRQNPIFLYREQLERLVNKELIEIDINNIKLTNKGLDLANQVWEEFV